jgi:hypothetical protein
LIRVTILLALVHLALLRSWGPVASLRYLLNWVFVISILHGAYTRRV